MKNNSTKKRLLVMSIIMFLVSVGLIVAGLHIVSLPKNIILADINNLFTNVSNYVDDENPVSNFIKENKNLNLLSKLEITNENISLLPFNKLDLNLELNENREKEITKLLATINKDGIGTANVKSYLANNNIYVGIEGITETLLSTELEFQSLLEKTTINEEDYKLMMNAIKETLIENTKDDEITKEPAAIEGSEDVSFTKLSYAVKKSNIYTYMSKFFEKVNNNKELNKVICNNFQIEEKDSAKTYDEIIKSIESYKDNDEVIFFYNVYYSGFNKVVMSEIDLVSYKLSYFRNENRKTINLYSSETENNLFSLTSKDKELNGYISDIITITGNYDKNEFNLNLEMETEDGQKESVSTTIKTETTVKEESLETTQNIKIDISTPNTLGISGTLNIKGSSTLSKGKEITLEELANSKRLEDLTEIEVQNMYNLARENTLFLSLIGAYENQL
ncbi:MAG: hypothetical protein PHQ64_01720 [Bacilli bacterium]|nr:hypothetical protein [Bacilli bacterium]